MGGLRRPRIWAAVCALSAMFSVASAQCDSGEVGELLNNCPHPVQTLASGSVHNLHFGVLDYTLPFVDRATGAVRGKFTFKAKAFSLEGLAGGALMMPAPTLRANKGSVFTLRYHNDLPVGAHASNIHTHGLHVSSIDDDVSVEVEPGRTRDFVYHLPLDHAGGTHWYHPHMHPLSEVFVMGGAAGLLLINDRTQDGRELPLGVLEAPEHELLLHSIRFERLLDLMDGFGNRSDTLNDYTGSLRYNVVDTTFGISFQAQGLDAPTGVAQLKRDMTLVNGQVLPRLQVERGRWTRLRLLNVASIFDLKMRAYNMSDANPARCRVKLLAIDGVYLPDGPRELVFEGGVPVNNAIWMHPANRADVLLRCDGAVGSRMGLYDEFNEFNNDDLFSVGQVNQGRDPVTGASLALDVRKKDLIMQFEVKARAAGGPNELPANFEFRPCLPVYLADLRSATIQPWWGTSKQFLVELQEKDLSLRPDHFDSWSSNNKTYQIQIAPFAFQGTTFRGFRDGPTAAADERNVSISLLGNTVELDLVGFNHPLHIHVNHFQLQADIAEGVFHRRGDWMDSSRPGFDAVSGVPVPIMIRFTPDIFTGRVPLHCHNLDHSDEGAFAQQWVLDNPSLPAGHVYKRMDRDWAAACPNEVAIVTPAPTAAPVAPTRAPSAVPSAQPSAQPSATPTQAPSTPQPSAAPTSRPTDQPVQPGTPTKSPTAPSAEPTAVPSARPSAAPTSNPTAKPTAKPTTVSPSAKPTDKPSPKPTPLPTLQPTEVEFSIEVPAALRVFAHEEVIISSEASTSRVQEPVQFCWRRLSGAYRDVIEAAVGGADKLTSCADDNAKSNLTALAAVFDSPGAPRTRRYLAIRPWSFNASVEYKFTLTATQGASRVSRTVIVRVSQPPPPVALSVTPAGVAVAGVTRLRFSAVAQADASPNALNYRFGLQRQTVAGETISYATTQPEPVLVDVPLPWTGGAWVGSEDDPTAVASVVVTGVNDAGAVSQLSSASSQIVVVRPPGSLREIYRGFDEGNVERTIRDQIAFASLVATYKLSESAEEELQAELRVAKAEIFANLDRIFGLLREVQLSREVHELLVLLMRYAAAGLRPTDLDGPAWLALLLSKFAQVVTKWLAQIEAESAAQKLQPASMIKKRFPVESGFIKVAFEMLGDLSTLPFLCSTSTPVSLAQAYTLLSQLSIAAKVAGQAPVQYAGVKLQTVSQRKFADTVAGTYLPPAAANGRGGSYVTMPASNFFTGVQAIYDEIAISVGRFPSVSLCAVAADANATDVATVFSRSGIRRKLAARAGGATDDGQEQVLSLAQLSPLASLTRTLALQDGSYAGSPEFAPYKVVVSDVLHLLTEHNSSTYNTATSRVTVGLAVTPLAPPSLSFVSPVQCGSFNSTRSEWSSAGCTVTSASATFISCDCVGVARKGADFGAFVEVTPHPAAGALVAKFVAPLVALWFLVSLGLFRRDTLDAQNIQLGAALFFLFPKHSRRPAQASRWTALKRAAMVKFKAMHKRGFTSVAAASSPRESLGRLLSKVAKAHSLLGLLVFDPRLPRLHRSLQTLLVVLGALALTPPLGLFASIALAVLALLIRLALLLHARYTRKGFHRVAHLAQAARESMSRRPATAGTAAAGARTSGGVSSKNAADSYSYSNPQLHLAIAPGTPSPPNSIPAAATPPPHSEEAELRERQIAVFLKSRSLKVYQNQHDVLARGSARLWLQLRGYLWFVPKSWRSPYLTRVFGGATHVSKDLRKAQRRLSKMEHEYGTRIGVCNLGSLLLSALLLAILGAEVYLIGFPMDNIFGAQPLMLAKLGTELAGVVDAAIALLAAWLIMEPLMLWIALLLARGSERGAGTSNSTPSAGLIRLAQPRERFYSWDSRVSTGSRGPKLPAPPRPELHEDIEKAARARRGEAARGREDRKDSAFTANSSTASGVKSAVSSAVGGVMRRLSKARGETYLSDSDEDEDDRRGEDEEEDDETVQSPPPRAPARGAQATADERAAAHRFKKQAKQRRNDEDEDEDDVRPNDANYV